MQGFRYKMRGFLATAAVAAVAVGLIAAPAQAHVTVTDTKPNKGSTASTSIGSVKVTFSGSLISGKLRVFGPDGKASIGKGGRDPRNVYRVTTRMKDGLPAGNYVARWSILSSDGHEQKGSFGFRLKR